MWVWNDYLLPYLVLDRTKYKTIPIHIQYLQGSYGHVDLGAVMALIMISILPVSYTHLDVYKRQVQGCPASGCPARATATKRAARHTCASNSARSNGPSTSAQSRAVYKRQPYALV